MSGTINLRFKDRLGNNLFQYAFARAYAERVGAELRTTAWDVQKVFSLKEGPIERALPERADMDFENWDGETDIEITGWALHQKCLIYSRKQAKEWMKIDPALLRDIPVRKYGIAAHLRRGDFVTMADYVAVSNESYDAACVDHGLDRRQLRFVSEESPIESLNVPANLSYLPDFVALMEAEILLRSNSTFSYWAAVLGNNRRVFAPDLTGIIPKAGVTQRAPFVAGNWPAISKVHPNCSDLHLRET